MPSRLPRKIEIHEVVLRDGIQNEKKLVSTDQKIKLINRLTECGVRRIEVSSFVNPRLVPQMADAEKLWSTFMRRKGVVYAALVLNERGLERAMRCGVPHVGIYVSASETHSRKNSNVSTAEAMREARLLIEKAHGAGMEVRAGVMNAFGCAYEGNVPQAKVIKLVKDLLKKEPDEICLADTSGMANPSQVRKLVKRVREIAGAAPISLHLHNTRGLGLANVWAAINEGVSIFDTSLGGLGGCPFIIGARGNIATEDTVNMLHETGVKTGINLDMLIEASLQFERYMGQKFPAMVSHLTRSHS
ncbi:MAG: hydroxymethylglutaryl-CoA lyase [Deltaproteobacteria bacterium]|nr:MAG: hydroxymethylglutaryl-CoA lyase [Deltaproteobacteria bacterium]